MKKQNIYIHRKNKFGTISYKINLQELILIILNNPTIIQNILIIPRVYI